MGEAFRGALRPRGSRELVSGKSGMSPTLPIGRALRRSSASSTTTPWTECKRALPTARVGGPDSTGPGAAQSGKYPARTFSSTACAARTTLPARSASPLDFMSFHAKGAPKVVDGDHVRMGMRSNQLRDDRPTASRSSPHFRVEEHADHHRRVRSRRLCGVLGAVGPAESRIATARCIRATPPRASRGSTNWRRGMA